MQKCDAVLLSSRPVEPPQYDSDHHGSNTWNESYGKCQNNLTSPVRNAMCIRERPFREGFKHR